MSHTTLTSDAQVMQCMEVWGGNQHADRSVSVSGLDAWVHSRPYQGAAGGGGDVYYVSSCATGRITRLLVADVSGHGQAVCDVAGELRRLMRGYVNYIDQTRFVAEMNSRFSAFAKSGCFATAVVSTYFAPTGTLSLCNAGHPPPLLYRAKTGEWSYLEAEPWEGDDGPGGSPPRETPANMPLGVLDLTDYEQFDVDLAAGDLVLCYTDSLPESFGGDKQQLGQEGLLQTARTLTVDDPAAVIPALLDAIARQCAGNLTADDVTAMLFRPSALNPHVPLGRRLAAPLRVLRGIAESVGSGEPAPIPEFTIANLGGALIHPLSRLWHGVRAGNVPAPQSRKVQDTPGADDEDAHAPSVR